MSARVSPEGCVLSQVLYMLMRDNLLTEIHYSDYHANDTAAPTNGKFPETLSVVLQTSREKFNTSWCLQIYGPTVN